MKKTLLVSFCVILLSVPSVFAQSTAGQNSPYRSMTRTIQWYGTQAAPTPLEKAQWALDDINAYRTLNGLPEFTDSLLNSAEPVTKAKTIRPRGFLRIRR